MGVSKKAVKKAAKKAAKKQKKAVAKAIAQSKAKRGKKEVIPVEDPVDLAMSTLARRNKAKAAAKDHVNCFAIAAKKAAKKAAEAKDPVNLAMARLAKEKKAKAVVYPAGVKKAKAVKAVVFPAGVVPVMKKRTVDGAEAAAAKANDKVVPVNDDEVVPVHHDKVVVKQTKKRKEDKFASFLKALHDSEMKKRRQKQQKKSKGANWKKYLAHKKDEEAQMNASHEWVAPTHWDAQAN